MNIFELPERDFLAMLPELAQQGVDTDGLRRRYREANSLAGPAAQRAQADVVARGRRPVAGGLLSKPEGSTGMDAVRGLEIEPMAGLLNALAGAERAITAPGQANLIPQQDMTLEALGTAGMAMTGGGAVAGPRALMDYDPNTARIFAGRNARNADLGALERAQTMAAQSASRDDIWRDTGWFQGPDGQWRFEIDDSKAILRQKPADALNYGGEYGTNYGGGLLHQPLLGGSMRGVDYEPAYPFMADMDFRGSNTVRGAFYDDDGAIKVEAPSASEGLPVALHELQHAVQREEGFTPGSSPRAMQTSSYSANAANRQETARLLSIIDDAERMGMDPFDALGAASDNAAQSERFRRLYIEYGSQGLRDRLYSLDTQLSREDPFGRYQRVAGEAEARNVEARRRFTADQRRATPPWQTLDVPEDELIVLGGRELDISANADEATGLLAMSAADTPAKQMARRILELRAAGRASEVTDDMMAAADPQYMFANTPLPMDEASRLARARDMGFDDEAFKGMRAYSGGPSYRYTSQGKELVSDAPLREITEINAPQQAYLPAQMAGFASSDPLVASSFQSWLPERGAVYPLRLRSGDMVEVDFEGRPARSGQFEAQQDPATYGAVMEAVGNTKNGGVIMRNTADEGDVFVPRNPNQVRSRFARFDPEFSHLSNLSAANASAPAGLLAMPAQEPQEQKLPFMSLLKGLLQ